MSTMIRVRPGPPPPVERKSAIRAGIVTVAWMLVEAVVAIGAGVLARGVLLTAFGIDSVIELVMRVSRGGTRGRLSNRRPQNGSIASIHHHRSVSRQPAHDAKLTSFRPKQ